MYLYSSISTLIIIQSHNFYDCITTCIILIIPKCINKYSCKFIKMKILKIRDFMKNFNLKNDTRNEIQLQRA